MNEPNEQETPTGDLQVGSNSLLGNSEPEDCIAQATYLLQLCQQDLIFGRTSTIWPRAKRAMDACQTLVDIFSPNTSLNLSGDEPE
jgi:hypothetical protein